MQSGQVVCGKYRLNQLLGSGGMAEVWSATNTFTERQIAIKFLSREVAKTPEAAGRFLQEAKVTARINHPNVIEIHDVGQTEEGQLFLVMELLTGYPLETALKQQTPTMTLYELALVMLEVAQALAAAHKSGIVHRDLKPTNIFLHCLREGIAIPKLLDFGVSKFLEEDQNNALTIAGTVLGSPLYMSPEQARGESDIDGRTDVFAFGAILFEALAGFRPYEAKNFNALIVKIATTQPRSIDECAGDVPESLRAVVRACMEFDRQRRVSSFDEIASMLRAALPELDMTPLRLPAPLVPASHADPDVTSAMPMMRTSERPGPSSLPPGSMPPGSVSASIPPGAVLMTTSSGPTAPSWHTPNTSYASIHAPPPSTRGLRPALAFGAVAATIALVLAGVLVFRAGSTPPAAAPLAASPQPVVTAPATIEPRAAAVPLRTETPSISVDTLPLASATPRATGHLFVTAHPGWCTLSIDGKERGPTPVAGVEVAPGAHKLECRAPSGKVARGAVSVAEGATVRYKFPLD